LIRVIIVKFFIAVRFNKIAVSSLRMMIAPKHAGAN